MSMNSGQSAFYDRSEVLYLVRRCIVTLSIINDCLIIFYISQFKILLTKTLIDYIRSFWKTGRNTGALRKRRICQSSVFSSLDLACHTDHHGHEFQKVPAGSPSPPRLTSQEGRIGQHNDHTTPQSKLALRPYVSNRYTLSKMIGVP